MHSSWPTQIGELFDQLPRATARVLLLDYDGTLAPFRPERDQAFPYPGVREILADILAGDHTRLVIISGRAISDLLPLLDLDPCPEIWGNHGWEQRDPDGTYRMLPIDPGDAALMQEAEESVAFLRASMGDAEERFERKPASVAVHWRGLPEGAAEALCGAVEQSWAVLANQGNLELHQFDGGLELRLLGRDKGVVIQEITAELEAETVVAYLGDDRTDEDAFRALKGKGLGILVRPEWRETEADAHLVPPDQLLAFLRQWQSAGGGHEHGGGER